MPTAEDTKACLDKLRKGATANGLTLADWDKYTAGAKLLPTTVSRPRASPKAARAGGTTSPRRSTTSAWPTAR